MSSAARITCPMCGHPLGRGTIEEVSIEFSTLNICGHCGFGLDLRWRGRGSALALPTPDVVLITPKADLTSQLDAMLPSGVRSETVEEPSDALGIYARALRRETPLSAIFVMTRGRDQLWSDISVAIRSLEEGFKVLQPVPIWYISSANLNAVEVSTFEELADIYWRECVDGQEHQSLLELAPQLFA